MTIEKLARINIQKLMPYQSARRLGGNGNIWLNANEYPQNVPFKITKKNLNRYPEFQPQNVINRYATYTGLKPEQIIMHRGADEGIELLIRTFCCPEKDIILLFTPTYGMYSINAQIIGIKCHSILLNIKNFKLNFHIIEKKLEHVKLIYICNPNNPTAHTFDIDDLKKLLNMVKNQSIVVVDEAYIEFCPKKTLTSWLKNYNHLVILRTLSKAFALAGLRCGFTLAHASIIQLLLKVIPPYPISTLTEDIAKQALSKKNIILMQKRVKKIIHNREWLIKNLKNFLGIRKIFHSDTNYILVKFDNVKKVFLAFKKNGIILRDQAHQPGLQGCLRMTVGTMKECKSIINTLEDFLLKKIELRN